MTSVAQVNLWGLQIGAVLVEDDADVAVFQYDPGFLGSGIEVAPLAMPLRSRPYAFPELSRLSFHGLPGLLADSLPDKFGNALIDAWLAEQGRTPEEFTSVDRLCYIGQRAMGALEYAPAIGPRSTQSKSLSVDSLVELASLALTKRSEFVASFKNVDRARAVKDILLVGTSAGGARAKAVIAYNPLTKEVRSGQVSAGPGFEHWILKFDGVSGNEDKDLHDPQGYGAIEFAYSLMAKGAGIDMTECRLLEENGRRHFMTRRFDRLPDGDKLHVQSLAALRHYDFNQAGAYSYEEAFDTIKRLRLGMDAIEQEFRRMTFNILARNQDDHVKNISFIMSRDGSWTLSPAFDVTYAYRPSSSWTGLHQMSMNGKRDHFDFADFQACARVAGLQRGRVETIVTEVGRAVEQWMSYADAAQVGEEEAAKIARTQVEVSIPSGIQSTIAWSPRRPEPCPARPRPAGGTPCSPGHPQPSPDRSPPASRPPRPSTPRRGRAA
jgi:serine/threonine-protein kinase HipA